MVTNFEWQVNVGSVNLIFLIDVLHRKAYNMAFVVVLKGIY